MTPGTRIVEVTADNLAEHPQVICFINPKHPHYRHKVEWLRARFREGLRIKLLFVEEQKGPAGYIEYTPGEKCWRAVSAKGYLFVHCLWVAPKKLQHRGLGNLLLAEVERDAKGTLGVAAVTSDSPFMATRELFVRNGYEVVQESGKDQLLVKQLKRGTLPSINDWQAKLRQLSGMHIVYSAQYPWVARFVREVEPVLRERKLTVTITELKTPAQAQRAPSLYGVFSYVKDGELLADRYVSVTRFRNILKGLEKKQRG